MTDSTSNNTGERTYNFTLEYAQREISSEIKRNGNKLSLHMDNNINAELELQPDGSLKQLSGNELPPSSLQFIAKHIIEQDQ